MPNPGYRPVGTGLGGLPSTVNPAPSMTRDGTGKPDGRDMVGGDWHGRPQCGHPTKLAESQRNQPVRTLATNTMPVNSIVRIVTNESND